MSELIRELEEDMRALRVKTLWHRYGNTLIGISIAIVLGTAGGVAWKSYARSRHEADTGRLLAALAVKDGRAEALAAVTRDTAGQATAALAGLHLADDALKASAPAPALAAYESIKEDARQEAALRALAGILAAQAAPSGAAAPAPTGKDAPFAAHAREALAWRLYHDGKRQEAQAAFSALASDVAAPPSLRQRAGLMASYLTGGA